MAITQDLIDSIDAALVKLATRGGSVSVRLPDGTSVQYSDGKALMDLRQRLVQELAIAQSDDASPFQELGGGLQGI
jgi:hypothetical protein